MATAVPARASAFAPFAGLPGRTVRQRDFEKFSVCELYLEAHSSVPHHANSVPYFFVLLRGGLREIRSLRAYDRRPGVAVFYPDGEERAFEVGPQPSSMLVVSLLPVLMRELENRRLPVRDAFEREGAMVDFLGRKLAVELRNSDCASALASEGIVMELLAEVFRVKSSQRTHTDRAFDILRERFREGISLSGIAREIGVNPSQLAREFRKRTGGSMGEYIRRLRIEYAIERLRSTLIPISEIADAAGFADQSHFCRVFRSCVGTSPAQFRASVRDGTSDPSRAA
jgi:AraC family transcriptional regulator